MAKRMEFTPLSKVGCILVTIEAVCQASDSREFEEVLDQLQQYGSAEVVKRDYIAEDFDAACNIRHSR